MILEKLKQNTFVVHNFYLIIKIILKKKKKLNNILITAGGSDLNDSILKIIKLIKKCLIFEKKIYILIGPFFSKEYIKKIKLFLKSDSSRLNF